MDVTQSEIDFANRALQACVDHGRQTRAAQLPAVEARKFDLMRQFYEMTTHHFLVGAMWRFGEQFELPVGARDRAFVCLIQLLVADGQSFEVAQRYVIDLKSSSLSADGKDNLAIACGYEFGDKEGALAAVFEQARNAPEVSGMPYRLIDRSKPIAAILSIAALVISLLMGRGWGEAIGTGIVVGLSTIGIALAIFWQIVREGKAK